MVQDSASRVKYKMNLAHFSSDNFKKYINFEPVNKFGAYE
jgi:hypothetical protein